MSVFQKSICELAEDLKSGKTSSKALVLEALNLIQTEDQAGKALNTVSEINPFCLYEAEMADRELAAGRNRGPLHGIPILLKDNIDVKGLHTTAGSYALSDNIADKDSPVAAGLRAAGAIILGKSNLSEFAYWMSTDHMPSGYSSLSGQVVHAYNPAFDPSGSSSGSAVAVSARFVPGAIGSETCGSLMSPGIANAICSLKPTVGLVSRTGIIPISHTQDTAGPMANRVEDCAALLTAMVGKDAEDPATALIPWEQSENKDYLSLLSKDMTGKRIGVYTDLSRPRTEKQETYQKLLKEKIQAAGGTVVEITYESTALECNTILTAEFRNGLERYLASHQCACRSLTDIIDFNKAHADRCLVHGQDLLEKSNAYSGMLKEPDYMAERLSMDEKGRELIDQVIDENDLSCLVTVCGRITSFAAVRGTCSMVVPAAPFNPEVYEPVSYFIIGKPFEEDHILQLGYVLQDC